MKIAQIAPLYESVPPRLYGGTERVISYLTEELVKMGHEVTLFASGDSRTKAKLVAHIDEALRLSQVYKDPLVHHIVQLQEVAERVCEFDILHFHTDYLHFPLIRKMGKPAVTTLHGRLDLPDLRYLYAKFNQQPLISISNAQRKPLPHVSWYSTVYHGLPANLHKPGDGSGGYLAFLGRISPEKRVDRAVKIAIRTGHKLKVAAKIDKADLGYYDREIKNLFCNPIVDFRAEINEKQKTHFLGKAKALLFPIDWPEPFGMVMIEAMACGTPVIAYGRGSVPEIIKPGVNGFIVNSIREAVDAVNNLHLIDRNKVRQWFEDNFSSPRMANDYLKVYRKVIVEKRSKSFNASSQDHIPAPSAFSEFPENNNMGRRLTAV